MKSDARVFTPIDRENVIELMFLSVSENEKHLISPNVEWLAQAPHVEESQTYGTFHECVAVGLISIIDPRLTSPEDQKKHYQSRCFYVWRLMIDHKHRHQGHGRAAMEFVMQEARNRGMEGISLTTTIHDKKSAINYAG